MLKPILLMALVLTSVGVFAMSLSAMGKVCLFSEMSGVLTIDGEPAPHVRLVRTGKWQSEQRDETVTDAQGRFHFPAMTERTLAKFLPMEFVASQTIEAHFTAKTGGPGFLKCRTAFGLCLIGQQQLSGQSFIVFRGTDYLADWLTNLNATLSRSSNSQPVHTGFSETFKSLRPQLTVLDSIAVILEKGVRLSETVSRWVLFLVRKILVLIGRSDMVESADITQTFLRQTLLELQHKVNAMVRKILDQSLVNGRSI